MKKIDEIKDEIMAGNFNIAFHKAYKSRAMNEFVNIIRENNLQGKFTSDLIDMVMNFNISNEKETKAFLNIGSKIGIEYFGEIYGKEFQEKFENAYKNGKVNLMTIAQIGTVGNGNQPEIQGKVIGQIIDLVDKDTLVGIHRTGGAVEGENLCEEGINLTGHLSSGVYSRDYSHIKSTLDKNISFYGNNVGTLFQQIAYGGNYKNMMRKDLVDIILVSIPKSEVEKSVDKQDVILEKNYGFLTLNPKYIKEYITVNTNSNTIENVTENPKFIGKSNINELSNKNEDKFQNYSKSNKPKFTVAEIGKATEGVSVTLKDKMRKFITNMKNRIFSKER